MNQGYFFRLMYVATVIVTIAATNTQGVSKKVPKKANPASGASWLALYTKSMSQAMVNPYPTNNQGLTLNPGSLERTSATMPSYIRNFRLMMAIGIKIKSPDGLDINPAEATSTTAAKYRRRIALSESSFTGFSITKDAIINVFV